MINQVAYVRADVFTCTYVPAHFRAASEEKMPARSPRRGVQLYSEVFMHVRTIAHGRRSITRTYRFTYVRTSTYVPFHPRTYVRTYLRTYVRTHLRTVRTYRFTHVLHIPYRTFTYVRIVSPTCAYPFRRASDGHPVRESVRTHELLTESVASARTLNSFYVRSFEPQIH